MQLRRALIAACVQRGIHILQTLCALEGRGRGGKGGVGGAGVGSEEGEGQEWEGRMKRGRSWE